MDEVHYLISDASKKVDVEAHVLRYWEEELELDIPRNEMGHRYYTDLHIRLFKQVKKPERKRVSAEGNQACAEPGPEKRTARLRESCPTKSWSAT